MEGNSWEWKLSQAIKRCRYCQYCLDQTLLVVIASFWCLRKTCMSSPFGDAFHVHTMHVKVIQFSQQGFGPVREQEKVLLLQWTFLSSFLSSLSPERRMEGACFQMFHGRWVSTLENGCTDRAMSLLHNVGVSAWRAMPPPEKNQCLLQRACSWN